MTDFPIDPRFISACDPDFNNFKPEDYYIKFVPTPQKSISEQLYKRITNLNKSGQYESCQLIQGYRACGKTIELCHLEFLLKKTDFFVVSYDCVHGRDPKIINDIPFLLVDIVQQINKAIEENNIKLRSQFFHNQLINTLKDLLLNKFILDKTTVKAGPLAFDVKSQDREKSELQEILKDHRYRLPNLIDEEVLKPLNQQLKEKEKKGLVIIVDGLDRIDSAKLFLDAGIRLKLKDCHIVYSVPATLKPSGELERLGTLHTLRRISVQNRDGSKNLDGIERLKQVILARAFPTVDEEQRLNLVYKLFEPPEIIDRLCLVSGGHLGNLFQILYKCISKNENLPVRQKLLNQVIREFCFDLEQKIKLQDSLKALELLREFVQYKKLSTRENEELLLKDDWLFEYHDSQGSWCRVNPILSETRTFQGLLNNINNFNYSS